MFGSRCEKWTLKKPIIVSAPKLISLPPTNESFQPNVLRAHLQCCIWKHGEEANPPDIDPTMHGWKRELMPSPKPWHQRYYELASCNWLSVVVKVPPGVHALAPCCHVLSDVGVQVDWTVRMSTQNSSGTHTYDEDDHLLTSISILFIEIRQHVYVFFFFYFFFFRVSLYQIVNSVCWSHAMANGSNFEEARFGWWSMYWAAVDYVVSCLFCSHSHAALSASPHFFVDSLYRTVQSTCTPTPVRSLFRVDSVFSSDLLHWRLILGPIRGSVLGWVRMLPTPASTLPQSMHPSTDPQGWHLISISWASLV